MKNNLLKLQKQLRDDGVLISFSGKFSQEIIEELGEAVKRYLESEDQPKSYIYNAFSIFIEQTQNIKHYCASQSEAMEYEQIASSCIVVIGKVMGGEKYICSGNLILNEDVEKLEQTINELILLDKQDLKRLYKQILKQEIGNENVSAGLGLVDIARKASKPLEASIEKIDGQFSFFTLKATV